MAMRIQVIGDDSISRLARAYAEYRLFAALSQVLDIDRVRHARLVLRRAPRRRHATAVACDVTIEVGGGDLLRVHADGDHPCAAIDRAAERILEGERGADGRACRDDHSQIAR